MQVHSNPAPLCAIGTVTPPAHCPYCDDWMVAPILSEFVEGGEIRHHWECESCGQTSSTTIMVTAE